MPGLKGALTVRINDGQSDRMVTRYCRGLKFTKVAPGGHKSISVHMNLPRNTFNDLGPEDRIYVYDARTMRTIIEGYLENPTPDDGPDGQSYDLSAVGGMALANDETRGLIYVDKMLDGWSEIHYGGSAHPDSTAGPYTDPDSGINGLRAQLPRGTVLATNSTAAADYRPIDRAGMQVAGVRIVTQSAKVDANYRTQFYDFTGSTNIGDISQMSTVSFDQTQWIGVSIVAGATKFLLQLNRTGAPGNVADDTTWTLFTGISVLGRRMDRNGTLLTTAAAHGSTALSVLASQVVEDLLGRLLTFCDPVTAQVDASAFAITQLAYPDGVKAAGLLNDLAVFEPDFVWEILETLDNGKHRFNFRAWPTTLDVATKAGLTNPVPARYEVSVRDGWRQSGSDVDLCNRILVSWTDPTGATQVTPVTAASLGLTGIGLPIDALGSRVKDADPITLPPEKSSLDIALRIGGQILTDKINPPKAGTVLVRRPIVDQVTGYPVAPWEIEPGYLCRIRETGDALRITQVDYDDDSCSMLLTLGTPVLSDEQRLARLDRAVEITVIGV